MKKNTIFIIIGIIVLIGALLFFGKSSTVPSKSSIQDVSSTKLAAGEVFPEFNLVDVDGKTFTRDSFNGKPSIIWFTTSWCVPCQIGAKEVAKLDDELGGNAFNVFVVFVDPREDESALRKWKQDFANKDWIIAFDNQSDALSKKINLKYLDTKYLLDSNGVIQNIDLQIANEKYLNVVRGIVENI